MVFSAPLPTSAMLSTNVSSKLPSTHATKLDNNTIGIVHGMKRASTIVSRNDNDTVTPAISIHNTTPDIASRSHNTLRTQIKNICTERDNKYVETIDNKNKKKRCMDRCDSSESSDSGVATSLSCTDSSTGSSEDASEPGSPYTLQTHLSEAQQSHHHNQNIFKSTCSKIMPPQTILATSSSTTDSGCTVSNGNNGSSNTAVIANGAAISNTNGNNNQQQSAKIKQQKQKTIQNNTTHNALPTLQWPWSTTSTTTMMSTVMNTTPGTNGSGILSKKRNTAGTLNDSTVKKSRTTQNVRTQNNNESTAHLCSSGAGTSSTKRLKSVALEESQTKITGYFKSQMKAQMHQSNGSAKRTETSIAPAPANVSSMSRSLNTNISDLHTNSLTINTPATTASLNKYFNILSQLKESNINNTNCNRDNAITSAMTSTSNDNNDHIVQVSAPTIINSTSIATALNTSTASLNLTSSAIAMPVPALKKIERSKPTKIAQVAPNLRKTPCSNSNSLAHSVSKSPPKKHVAIAPRTPEMKQQQLSGISKVDASKQVSVPTPSTQLAANQPAVLLTAIRLPAQAPTPTTTLKPTVAATTKLSAAPNGVANTGTNLAPTNPTLYQLPLQLSNLVQLPQLLAANGTNIMQLNNVTAATTTAKNVAGTSSTAGSTSSAQAAQAAAAQYFLNGTVFKLQQFTTATTTTATSAVTAASATAPANPFNLISNNDLQEMLFKQQLQQQKVTASPQTATNSASFQEMFQQQIAAAIAGTQQQQQFQQLQRMNATTNMQQQPVFMATPAGLLLNAASLPAMLAQAAAALAVNNSVVQAQTKPVAMPPTHQLPALQPIQANTLPVLSSIFTPQSQHGAIAGQQEQPEQQFHHQHLAGVPLAQSQTSQYLTATQPPPLSAVSATTNCGTARNTPITTATSNSNVVATNPTSSSKLAIVKATANTQFSALNTQPPPLVTISNTKPRCPSANAPAAATTVMNMVNAKPSALAKPYQRRTPKVVSSQPPPIVLESKSIAATGACKAKMTSGKVVASPTTPPPLVPAINSNSGVKEMASKRGSIAPTTSKSNAAIPAPALVSISSNTSLSSTLTQSAAGMVKTNSTATNNLAANTNATVNNTATDLFDLIKNSNGAVSISAGNACANISVPATFIKVKDEPVEEAASNVLCQRGFNGDPKTNARTSFNMHSLSADIKVEFLEDTTKMDPSVAAVNIHECSSLSFSSNSVSSAADLSLEASTPASTNSSRFSVRSPLPTPSPITSVSSSSLSSHKSQPFAQDCSTSSAVSDSNSNSCTISEHALRASSQDLLSEMVTSSCISSPSPSCSPISHLCATTTYIKMRSQIYDTDKDSTESAEEKRDQPTPESGIGGSLSLSESSNSIISAITSKSTTTNSLQNTKNESTVFHSKNSIVCSSREDAVLVKNDSLLHASANNNKSSIESNSYTLSSPIINANGASIASSSPAPTIIDTQLAESNSSSLSKSAISPILSQPKTIRFPAESGFRHGQKGVKRHDGVCYWDNCNKKHESSSKLLDHMQTQHVNTQTGPFACLWVGCKVFNRESCSRRWLERHVLSHGGSKQFKCIVEGCGLRFGSQLALQKHVNNHFTVTESKENTNKRTSDPPVPKQLRKNGKKLRYRRQPFSARMFDFFDAGIMEGLQHRLRQISILTNGCNSITFQGNCIMRRKTLKGSFECFVRWSPHEIISDEWLPASEEPYTKTVNIKEMKPAEKTKVETLLTTAYKMPYSQVLFDSDSEDVNSEYHDTSGTDYDESTNDDDIESESSTISYNKVSFTNVREHQYKKHPRKPIKRCTPSAVVAIIAKCEPVQNKSKTSISAAIN